MLHINKALLAATGVLGWDATPTWGGSLSMVRPVPERLDLYFHM